MCITKALRKGSSNPAWLRVTLDDCRLLNSGSTMVWPDFSDELLFLVRVREMVRRKTDVATGHSENGKGLLVINMSITIDVFLLADRHVRRMKLKASITRRPDFLCC